MTNLKRFSLILISACVLINCSTAFSQNRGSRRVAIIGGGSAGLSAAHYILSYVNGAEITVFEKEAQVGGNATTISVTNSSTKIPVDIGAQYFTDGSWDQFINLLRSYQLVSDELVFEINATLAIFNKANKKPNFISPKGLLLRGEKLSNLTQFYRFHKAAHELYEAGSTSNLTAEKWINSLKLTDAFKQKIAYPFLANTSCVSIEKVKQLSAYELVKVFAFRGPSNKQYFYVLKNGLGATLNSLGDSLAKRGVQFKVATTVTSVELSGTKYQFTTNKSTEEFDFVIFATHPDQAVEILKQDVHFQQVTEVLERFNYTKLTSVLHTDESFIYSKKPSFLNIQTDHTGNSYLNSTQNLGLINADFEGIYKSWFTEEDLKKVRDNGTFLESKTFYLPLVDEKFTNALLELYKCASTFPHLFFAGSWSEGIDNQENAVQSGEKAALKCRKYFDRM
jgi:predicted NAD/FAD-binding protein